ncbi:putative holin-like toxin [Paenibacillus sp. FSL R10-2199]
MEDWVRILKFIHSWSVMFMFGMFIIALLNYLKKK